MEMDDGLREEQIRARVAAATAGPWWCEEDADGWVLHGTGGVVPADGPAPEQVLTRDVLRIRKTQRGGRAPGAADAELIAMARTDLPFLLELLDRERDTADRLRGEIAMARAGQGDVARGG